MIELTEMALITTTINTAEVLKLYRRMNPDIPFFITGDRKSPHEKLKQLAKDLGNVHYYDVEDQKKLGYKSSEIIGWNTIRRRNIALLEALRYGADKIVTLDDDNIPLSSSYFQDFNILLSQGFDGLMASTLKGWFNVGDYFSPKIYHRGFPLEYRQMEREVQFIPVVDKKIGVAAGLWFGDPDIDAMDRITNQPIVHQISQILHEGVVVEEGIFSPFDSQNTAFVRQLAPLMMMLEVGRYDDIWASYLTQRVMHEKGFHVHYGPPFVWQERNRQNLLGNLEAEIFGMKHTPRFCEELRRVELDKGSVIDNLQTIYGELAQHGKDYLPEAMLKQFDPWLEDLEQVM